MSRWPGRLITRNPVTPGGTAPTASAPGIWTLPEMAYWKKQGLWPDASADVYWGYVSYLMATSSLSNANNNLFVDSSGAFNPVTRSGNTTQGSVTPYGTLWSNYFDGSSYLSAPASAAFAFGTGDFTIECWVNFMPGSASGRITTRAPGGGAFGTWGFNISPTTFTFSEVIGGEPGVSASGLPNMTNAWVHLAACRSGSTLRLFANGVLVGSGSNTTDFNNSSYSLGIGASYETAITGYLSNVRIVKGTALYTAAFTPSLNPLTAVSGTSILTCQSNRFRDNSGNAFALTATGTPRVVPSSPFILNSPGAVYNQSDISYWSGYFDGTSDSLSYTGGSSIAFGTGDFTIELWAYLTNTGTYSPFLRPDDSGVFPEFGYDFGSGQLKFDARNGAIVAVTTTMPTAQWVHLAACRSGTNLRLFVNGSQVGTTTTNSTNFGTTTGVIRLGGSSFSASHTVNGYLSNFRVVNGTALYTGNFTPPTTPLTAVSNTSLLTCQNAAFTDNSTNNFVITANGNATVTGNNPYQSGYYSNYFDGSGDYITAPANAAFDLGSGNFTLECWVYNNEVSRNIGYAGVWSTSYILYREATVYRFYYFGPGGSPLTSSIPAVAGAWTHLAVVRNGSTLTFYVNGAVGATANVGTTAFNNGSTLPFHIGTNQDGPSTYGLNGYMSNLRLVKGTAVYTSAFTPPTAPLTAISGTSLLTCQANRLIDSSSNAFALTKVGDTSVVPFDPFYTATVASNGGSMYFDGSSDWLSAPNLAANFSSGNFTAECWIYFNSNSVGYQPILANAGTADQQGWALILETNNTLNLYTSSGSSWTWNINTSYIPPARAWTHIAIVRNGSTITMYANGVSLGTTNISTNAIASPSGAFYAGYYPYFPGGARSLNGYMSDVRLTPGTVVYTGNFTPPTAPLTPSANTTLLLNGMNAGEYDAAMQNNFETIGNAQASSVQAKYGTTSAYFSGAADNYITAPSSPAFQFGTGDLTIEGWIYLTGDTITNPDGNRSATICSGIGATGVSNDFWFNVTGNTTTTGTGLNFQVFNGGSGTVIFNTAYSFSKSTWYHVAFTRSGNNVYLFVNGTVIASTTYSGTITAGTNPLRIGYGQTGSINYRQPFPGYIDDLRITKGYARYTANFTPPTAALPVY